MENQSVRPLPVSPKEERPIQDEWGIYDPEQAGFEAILRKLGERDAKKPASSSDAAKR